MSNLPSRGLQCDRKNDLEVSSFISEYNSTHESTNKPMNTDQPTEITPIEEPLEPSLEVKARVAANEENKRKLAEVSTYLFTYLLRI